MEKQKSVKIKIAERIAPILGSRDVVQELDNSIKKTRNNLVDLDFSKVDFVSRSAAHELVSLKEKWNKKSKNISFVNTNQDVAKMLRAIAANKALPKEKPVSYKPKVVSIESLAKI